MKLPEYVIRCVTRLEQAGYPCYAVGGCVRDACLDITPHDYDLCTAAAPYTVQSLFSDMPLVLAGEKHGTVGIVTEQGMVEITTFRAEGGYQDSRHPDWVRFVDTVEKDLARRDFTVNAIAFSPTRGYADPFGGRQDLMNRVLRAVGDPDTRFQEDALRILRGVRFAVRFGLRVEESTLRAMEKNAPLMDKLAKERIFDELCKLLPLVSAEDLILFAPILARVLPELAPTIGFCQYTPHHAFDVFTHTAYVTQAVPRELALRWAALLHDIGKVPCFTLDEDRRGHFNGHAKVSAQMAQDVLSRLKAPTALRERVVFLVGEHMTPLLPDKKLLRRRLSRYGEEGLRQLLLLQEADFCSKGVAGEATAFPEISALLDEILEERSCLTIKELAVNGHDLMALGLSGRQIGQAQRRLLELVLEEAVPNERDALLNAAQSL